MPLLDLNKITAGLSATWVGYLRDWDRTVRSANYPETTRYNYLLAAAQLARYLGEYLLGHLNIQTTRGYVAVFDEDIVRHYVAFLDQRRELRPAEEWAEFDEHFDKRKVELGSCGRPYGTPCQHEHACIRCPMLHVNPKMLARLDELEADLLDRRKRAEAENWVGEIEGVDMTLTFLRAKRDDTQRRLRRPTVDLGIPALTRASDQQEKPK